jgi:amidase
VALQGVVEGMAERRFQTDNVVPLPWREATLAPKLKIGYWVDDGFVKTSPAGVRALEETATALRALGHEVVPFAPPSASQALAIFSALTSADGYKQLLGNIGPDPMEPSMKLVTLGSTVPRWVLWLASTFIKYALGDTAFGDILYVSKPKSASEYLLWSAERDDFIKEFRQRVS